VSEPLTQDAIERLLTESRGEPLAMKAVHMRVDVTPENFRALWDTLHEQLKLVGQLQAENQRLKSEKKHTETMFNSLMRTVFKEADQ